MTAGEGEEAQVAWIVEFDVLAYPALVTLNLLSWIKQMLTLTEEKCTYASV